MPRRALFLTNENSRSCAALLPQATAALEAGGLELVRPKIGSKDEVVPTILREAPSVDCVIVMGGDGSVNTALPGVKQTGLPLGVLPAGTANDLARTLKLPTTIPEAAAVITAGNATGIDLGEVNGHYFINAASLGLSVSVTETLTKDLKARWGIFAYAIASSKALWKAKGFGARIEIDGSTDIVRTTQIVVGNGKHFGSGMTVHEHATIDDGQLDLYSVGIRKWWRFLYAFKTIRQGTHERHPEVFNGRGKVITITTKRPRPITADGEMVAETPATFRMHSKAIRIFTPAALNG